MDRVTSRRAQGYRRLGSGPLTNAGGTAAVRPMGARKAAPATETAGKSTKPRDIFLAGRSKISSSAVRPNSPFTTSSPKSASVRVEFTERSTIAEFIIPGVKEKLTPKRELRLPTVRRGAEAMWLKFSFSKGNQSHARDGIGISYRNIAMAEDAAVHISVFGPKATQEIDYRLYADEHYIEKPKHLSGSYGWGNAEGTYVGKNASMIHPDGTLRVRVEFIGMTGAGPAK